MSLTDGSSTSKTPARTGRAVLALLALTLFAPAPSATAAPPDPARGKALFTKLCVSCHGDQAQGKREVNSPALHTQEPWYLLAQLQKFRAGLRGTNPQDVPGSTMRPVAQALPDEQALNDLATYVSSITGPPAKNEVKGDVAAGAATYKRVCLACHGANGMGKPELKSPALVGQNDWYMVNQLVKFKAGHRGADPKDVSGAQMKAIASTLPSEQAMRDVAAYIATLK